MRHQVERMTFDAKSLEDVPLGDRVDIAPHLGDQKLHSGGMSRHFQLKSAHNYSYCKFGVANRICMKCDDRV